MEGSWKRKSSHLDFIGFGRDEDVTKGNVAMLQAFTMGKSQDFGYLVERPEDDTYRDSLTQATEIVH